MFICMVPQQVVYPQTPVLLEKGLSCNQVVATMLEEHFPGVALLVSEVAEANFLLRKHLEKAWIPGTKQYEALGENSTATWDAVIFQVSPRRFCTIAKHCRQASSPLTVACKFPVQPHYCKARMKGFQCCGEALQGAQRSGAGLGAAKPLHACMQEESRQIALGGEDAQESLQAFKDLSALARNRGAQVGMVQTWAWISGEGKMWPTFEQMQVRVLPNHLTDSMCDCKRRLICSPHVSTWGRAARVLFGSRTSASLLIIERRGCCRMMWAQHVQRQSLDA